MTDLNDAAVLITGATGGFGREMTRQFLDAGSRLVVTDIDSGPLDALCSEFDSGGDRIAAAVTANLLDEAGCRALFDSVRALGLTPDIIVNNAGIGVGGRFDHVPADRWENIIHLNLLAPMRLCYLFLPAMIERGSGHIVNISSLAGWVGSTGLSSYCASKFGLRGFGDSLAADYREQGIKISTVYPCFSRTPILDSEQFGYEQRRQVPEHMISDPADVVAKIIDGIRRDRSDIFPDKLSRKIHYLKRFVPWVLPYIDRRIQEQALPDS
ncbi:MAG: SDR family oxidoreductase [Woeseiaceae bacterium]|nr:SDR family oxidoreductase [Woeseiaceae bacterium]